MFPGFHSGYCSDCSLVCDTVSSCSWLPTFQGSVLPPSQYFSLNAVHPDVLFDSQGMRIIQSNTSFILLKYAYIQGYMFQLRGAIIGPLP